VRPNAVAILPKLVRHFGEPFADSSAIPTSYLAELTRSHVTVALSGDGGDEIFGGYGRHLANRLGEQWNDASPLTRALSGAVARRPYDRQRASRARRFLVAAGRSRAARYRGWAGVFSPDAVAALAPGAGDGQADVDRLFAEVSALDSIDAVLAVDTRFYLPTDLLVKMDIATMMHSLEARSPFLDRELAEFAARLPGSMKVRRLTTKYILKRALGGVLAPETLHREKRGFAVPIGTWFRGELREFLSDHLQAARVASAGLVEQGAVTRLMAEHAAGTDRTHELWTLLMLELWYREFVTP
jgi:asparagine synthase (glutamine-hydrolysing)